MSAQNTSKTNHSAAPGAAKTADIAPALIGDRELTDEELDRVSGGWFSLANPLPTPKPVRPVRGDAPIENNPVR